MPTVNIDGFGNVQFPDSMTSDQIDTAIRTQVMRSPEYVAARQQTVGQLGQQAVNASRGQDPPQDWSLGGLAKGAIANTFEGLKNLITTNPVDTMKGLLAAQGHELDRARAASDAGDYAGAATHALAYLTPVFGPAAVAAGEKMASGKVSEGLGETLALAGGGEAGKLAAKGLQAAAPAIQDTASALYRSVLKPSTSLEPADAAAVVRTGLDNNIPISAPGVRKLNGLISDLGAKVRARVTSGAQNGAVVDPAAAATRVDSVRARFANQVNPVDDMNAINASKQEFLDRHTTPGTPAQPGTTLFNANGQPVQVGGTPGTPATLNPIPADNALDLVQGTYQRLKKSYGELSSAQVEAQKGLARGVKEELQQQFPELKALTEKQWQFLQLDPEIDRAVNRIANHEPLGLIPAMAVDAGMAAHGGGAAVAAGVLAKIVTSPGLRSRLAIALDMGGRNAATASIPVAQRTAGALGRVGQLNQRLNDYAASLAAYAQTPATAGP